MHEFVVDRVVILPLNENTLLRCEVITGMIIRQPGKTRSQLIIDDYSLFLTTPSFAAKRYESLQVEVAIAHDLNGHVSVIALRNATVYDREWEEISPLGRGLKSTD